MCVCVSRAPQVNGLLELYRAVDSGKYVYPEDDLVTLTGKRGATIQQYAEATQAGFQ